MRVGGTHSKKLCKALIGPAHISQTVWRSELHRCHLTACELESGFVCLQKCVEKAASVLHEQLICQESGWGVKGMLMCCLLI